MAERALDLYPLFGVTMIQSMYTEPHQRPLVASSEGRLWPRVVMASPAFTWIRMLWRCWQDRTPCDEARYIRALQGGASPVAIRVATKLRAVALPLLDHAKYLDVPAEPR